MALIYLTQKSTLSLKLHFRVPAALYKNSKHFGGEVLKVFAGLMKASSVQVR
jgi:hypothetical protein